MMNMYDINVYGAILCNIHATSMLAKYTVYAC